MLFGKVDLFGFLSAKIDLEEFVGLDWLDTEEVGVLKSDFLLPSLGPSAWLLSERHICIQSNWDFI